MLFVVHLERLQPSATKADRCFPMQGPNRLSSHGCGPRSRRLPSNGTLKIDELIDAIDAILNAEDTAGVAPSANRVRSLDANSSLP